MDTTAGTLNFSAVLTPGEVIPMNFRSWNATVLSVNENEVTLKQNVHVGDVVATQDGRYGKVTGINSTSYDVDLNLPVAGKNLNFEVTLVEVKK